MRTFIPLAAVVLLTAGAATIPALTDAQTAKVKHHTWKKANIDTSAMSASMSAAGASFEQPSAPGSNMAPGQVQPGAITSDTATSANAMPPAASTDTTTQASPSTSTMAQPGASASTSAGASSSMDSSSSAPQ